MPTTRNPRRGSLQFWPRKRAKRLVARVRSWAPEKEAKLLGFAGYKVGMTHLIINDNRKTSTTKGMDVFCPATIIECPPLKIASIRFYKKDLHQTRAVSEIIAQDLDKELARKVSLPKRGKGGKAVPEVYDYIHILVYTQPKLTGIGKKKPELFEIALGGKKNEQLAYAQEKLGKEITIQEIFKEGQQVDIHAVTRGKGVQGPMRRFGISRRNHKSEKSIRNPGTLGSWIAQGHVMWRVAKAGKMGQHVRTEYNKWLLKIGQDATDIKNKSGYKRYGIVKNSYVFIKGSIAGPSKRLIRFTVPMRPSKKIPGAAPSITYAHMK